MMQVNRHQFDTILRSYYDQTQQNLTVEELVKYLERGGYRLSFDESEMENLGGQLETELDVDLSSDESALFDESEMENLGGQLETELDVDLSSDEGELFDESEMDSKPKAATEAEQAKDLENFITSQKEKIEQNIQFNSGQIEIDTDSHGNQNQLPNSEFPEQKILDSLMDVNTDSSETDPRPPEASNLLDDKSKGESIHSNESDKHSVKSTPGVVADNFGIFSASDDLSASPRTKEEQIGYVIGNTEKDDHIDRLRTDESKTKIDTSNDPLVQTKELHATSADDDMMSITSPISDTPSSANDYEELFGNGDITQGKLSKQVAVLSGDLEVNSDTMAVSGPTVVDSKSKGGSNETNVLQNDNSTERGNESDANGETKELSQGEQTQTEASIDKNQLQFDDNSSVVLQQINSQSNKFKSFNLLDQETTIAVEEQESPKRLRNRGKIERAGLMGPPDEKQNQKGEKEQTKNQLSTDPSLPIIGTNKKKSVVNRTKVDKEENRTTLGETPVDSELEKLLNHITIMSETTLEPSVKIESELENKAQPAKRSRIGRKRRRPHTKDRINQSTQTNAKQKPREKRPSQSSGKKERIDSDMADVLAALEKLQD